VHSVIIEALGFRYVTRSMYSLIAWNRKDSFSDVPFINNAFLTYEIVRMDSDRPDLLLCELVSMRTNDFRMDNLR